MNNCPICHNTGYISLYHSNRRGVLRRYETFCVCQEGKQKEERDEEIQKMIEGYDQKNKELRIKE